MTKSIIFLPDNLELDYENTETRQDRLNFLRDTETIRGIFLKPCPFCGGAPKFTDSYWANGSHVDHKVRCTECGVTAERGSWVGDRDAVECWNRRK